MGEAWSNQLIQLIVLSLPGGYSGLFGYQPAPGPGNLVISITAQAGTDPFGNPYPAGIQVGPASGPQVEITGGNPATVSFPINDPAITSQPVLFGFETSPGPAQWAGLAIQGAGINVAGHRDEVLIGLNSPSKDGSSSANGEIDFVNDAGAGTIMAVWDNNGFAIRRCPQITATDPSVVATSVSPAIQETWHDMRPLQNLFIGTNAGYLPPQFRKVADGTIHFAGYVKTPPTTGCVPSPECQPWPSPMVRDRRARSRRDASKSYRQGKRRRGIGRYAHVPSPNDYRYMGPV